LEGRTRRLSHLRPAVYPPVHMAALISGTIKARKWRLSMKIVISFCLDV